MWSLASSIIDTSRRSNTCASPTLKVWIFLKVRRELNLKNWFKFEDSLVLMILEAFLKNVNAKKLLNSRYALLFCVKNSFILEMVESNWLFLKFLIFQFKGLADLERGVILAPVNSTSATATSKTSFKQSAKGRHSSSNSSRKESRVTLMVMIISTNSLLGNVPNSISSLLFTLNLLSSLNYNVYLIFGNFLLFFSHAVHFFIYLGFNGKFRRRLWSLFKR